MGNGMFALRMIGCTTMFLAWSTRAEAAEPVALELDTSNLPADAAPYFSQSIAERAQERLQTSGYELAPASHRTSLLLKMEVRRLDPADVF